MSAFGAEPCEPWVNPSNLLGLLEDVEALDADSTGTFLLGRAPDVGAMVFVQHGRICWAVSADMTGRLTDLLLRVGAVGSSRGHLESLYQECRAQSMPLGDTLVRRGLISAEAMREVLLQHTGEALLSCAGRIKAGARFRWEPHSERSYDAGNTFLPSEVLVAMSALQQPATAQCARDALARHIPSSAGGVVYVRVQDCTPIAMSGCAWSTGDLVEVGRWGACTADVAGVLSPQPRVISRFGSEALVVWQRQQLLHVAVCSEPSDTAFVIASHARG